MKRPQIKHPKSSNPGEADAFLTNQAITPEESRINRLVRQLDEKDAEKKDLEIELLEVYRALFAALDDNEY
jgi:hypothetical protein